VDGRHRPAPWDDMGCAHRRRERQYFRGPGIIWPNDQPQRGTGWRQNYLSTAAVGWTSPLKPGFCNQLKIGSGSHLLSDRQAVDLPDGVSCFDGWSAGRLDIARKNSPGPPVGLWSPPRMKKIAAGSQSRAMLLLGMKIVAPLDNQHDHPFRMTVPLPSST